MFQNYNSKQKTAFFIALSIFIIINLLSLGIVIGKNISSEHETNFNITVQIDRSERIINANYEIGESISSEVGRSKISTDNALILAPSPYRLRFLDENTIEADEGSLLLLTKEDLKLVTNKKSINLQKGSYILNLNNLIVLKGSVIVNNIQVDKNTVINLNNDNIHKFSREDLTNEEYLRELSLIAKIFKEDIPELSDTVPPRLISINPLNNFRTTSSSVKVTGKTESESIVNINNNRATIDKIGNFSQTISLHEGTNLVVVEIIDEYGNKSAQTFTYIKE